MPPSEPIAPVYAQPHAAAEREYEAALVAWTAEAGARIRRALTPLLAEDDRADGRRRDNALARILSALAALRAWAVRRPLPAWSVQKTGEAVAAHAERGAARLLASAPDAPEEAKRPIPPARKQTPTMRAWARENARLIRSVDERLLDEVAAVVSEGVEAGKRTETIAGELARRLEVSESRARLIARDQVGKLNAAVTQERLKAAGATAYRWSTSRDERVRPSHAALEGKVFAWDHPPAEGHPGAAVLCRCVAIPVFGDVAFSKAERPPSGIQGVAEERKPKLSKPPAVRQMLKDGRLSYHPSAQKVRYAELREDLEQALGRAPSEVLETVLKRGYRLEVGEFLDSVAGFNGRSGGFGVYDFRNNKSAVALEAVREYLAEGSGYSVGKTVLHELGHAIDGLGYPLSSQPFFERWHRNAVEDGSLQAFLEHHGIQPPRYTRLNDLARGEAWAEILGHAWYDPARRSDIDIRWPGLLQWMEKEIRDAHGIGGG
jgi:SPP1 gp7 family putative phage head morphogenesis protein